MDVRQENEHSSITARGISVLSLLLPRSFSPMEVGAWQPATDLIPS